MLVDCLEKKYSKDFLEKSKKAIRESLNQKYREASRETHKSIRRSLENEMTIGHSTRLLCSSSSDEGDN